MLNKNKPYDPKQEAKDAVATLADFFNTTSGVAEEFAEEILKVHPTLQQLIMNGFILCVKRWSTMYEKGWYDLRNEATCRLAKQIMTKIDEDYLYFPHV